MRLLLGQLLLLCNWTSVCLLEMISLVSFHLAILCILLPHHWRQLLLLTHLCVHESNFLRDSLGLYDELALLKKLAGTQWGANADNLRKTYTGYVRPTLEYGMAAWGTTAPSNIDSIAKVQNQNIRLITGSLRSTPISAMETETGLQSLEERRDNKILMQFSKFTTLS